MELLLDGEYILGMDIGGTKLATVVSDRDGEILNKTQRLTKSARGPRKIIEDIVDMARETIRHSRAREERIIGIGVSCGGPLDTKTGVVYSPPNLPGWDEIPLKDMLEQKLGFAALVENDANAGALAEWMFGAGRGHQNVVYMTMGTGIGGGLVLDGRLYHGTTDAAGEVGHMSLVPDGPTCGCGKRGCLEALCSGPAIARRAREAIEGDPDTLMMDLADGRPDNVTGELVMEAARQGDRLANEIVLETAEFMAQGLGNIVNILNPEVIIVGTILVKAQDLLLEPIREALKKHTWERLWRTVEVLPAQLGDYVGDLAAIAVVKQFL